MASKTKLSKGILDMKFMKRTKDKVTKEADDAEGRAMYASQITDKMLRHGECPFVIESSFVPCENLTEGRFSFRGMNPEIERLLELEQLARQAIVCKDIKKDVSDQEMADEYHGNLTNTMAKQYNNRRGNDHRKKNWAEGNSNGGGRQKMYLPEPKNQQQQSHNHHQHNNPKRPRFVKPDEDDQ